MKMGVSSLMNDANCTFDVLFSRMEFKYIEIISFNPNSEGVPDPHLLLGGGPSKCRIQGPNERKFCL